MFFPYWNMTHPELTSFIAGIVPDFFNVRSVCLHFIWRNDGERNVGYIEDSVALQEALQKILYASRKASLTCA